MSIIVTAYSPTLFSVLSGTIEEIIELNRIEATPLHIGQEIHLDEEIIEKICNKEFNTAIMDKDVLLKTLEEHGATDIMESQGDISCECEAFHLDFYKKINEPYTVRISYKSEQGINELLEDLGNEYSTNAQEVSYNKIMERIQAQNLMIENEEVYDDDTIVLTINLE